MSSDSERLGKLAADYRKFADDQAKDDNEAAANPEWLGKCNICDVMTVGFHCPSCLLLAANALDSQANKEKGE